MRPSDLHRISFCSAKVNPSTTVLTFEVVSPKERRQGVRIIKPFMIHPHTDDCLCPVKLFLLVRDHPSAQDKRPADHLFVNSIRPTQPVESNTISTWLRKLVRLSTQEKRVSVRSLDSSLALRSGIALDDIVTLGNWQSSTTFDQFYRREHLSLVDFTNSVLQPHSIPLSADDLVPLSR